MKGQESMREEENIHPALKVIYSDDIDAIIQAGKDARALDLMSKIDQLLEYNQKVQEGDDEILFKQGFQGAVDIIMNLRINEFLSR